MGILDNNLPRRGMRGKGVGERERGTWLPAAKPPGQSKYDKKKDQYRRTMIYE